MYNANVIESGLQWAVYECHKASAFAGWWKVPINIPEKIALIHSEISEALEGYRKDEMDKHLPNRKAIEVELADAIHRICDLAGYLKLNLGKALIEKMEYNAQREDHKLENRAKLGGKRF